MCWLTVWPMAASPSASARVLLAVHRSGEEGSPRVCRIDQGLQVRQQGPVLVGETLSAGAGAPDPVGRLHPLVHLDHRTMDGGPGHPRRPGHHGDATTAQGPGLGTGQDPLLPFVEVGEHDSELRPQRLFVRDHTWSLSPGSP